MVVGTHRDNSNIWLYLELRVTIGSMEMKIKQNELFKSSENIQKNEDGSDSVVSDNCSLYVRSGKSRKSIL